MTTPAGDAPPRAPPAGVVTPPGTTVRVDGDVAVVQNLSTLRGRFSGQATDTDLRGTFVWERRDGRWRLVTNQLTPVLP